MHSHAESPQAEKEQWYKEWGVDTALEHRSGLVDANVLPAAREVYLLQRKESSVGKNLGKTSGWVHRATLKQKNVTMIAGCQYDLIDDEGLHIKVNGKKRVLDVDHVIMCAGQESNRSLADELIELGAEKQGMKIHVIGGADLAAELDAKRAINQGSRLAASI